jgi:hypothetical protein
MSYRNLAIIDLAIIGCVCGSLSGLLLGCTTIKSIDPFQPTVLHEDFSDALLDSVLGRFVDAEGRVDYTSLKANSADLEA